MPASAVKNFAKSASIRPMSFVPKTKSAAFIRASNLASAKRPVSQNGATLELSDSAALNLLSAIIFAWEVMKDMQAFSGSVLVCEFYKKFSGQTIVASRTLNTRFLGEKEQMDDLFFSKEFRVFADDRVEARYLLTPAFMQRLRELKEKFAGKIGLSAAFMDDKLYLFLNGAKNKFETTLFSPPPSLGDAAEIKNEILELLQVIDELGLNPNLSGAAIFG